MKTVLLDYGASNLHSVYKALQAAGLEPLLSAIPSEAQDADALILPGQGHFGQAMQSFLASGFERVVLEHLAANKPFLGICVGLQLLMNSSEEAPGVAGLGAIKGSVKRFPEGAPSVPQMGWNELSLLGQPPLLEGVDNGAFVYFANSYYVDFEEDLAGSSTTYAGVTFKSCVSHGPLNATQFHPEKSQAVGLKILNNFKNLAERSAALDS